MLADNFECFTTFGGPQARSPPLPPGLQGLGVSYGVVSGCADDIMMCLPMQWEL